MASSDYVIVERLPTPQQYYNLREVVPGMSTPPMEAVPKALAGSFVSFMAFERKHMIDETTPSSDQRPVGLGRLLGDGALFLQLCDVAVHPDHQGRGIGKGIMQALVDHVDKHAPHAYVSLVGSPVGQKLYPKYGFEDVKPSMGMFRCHRLQKNPEYRKMQEAKAAAILSGIRESDGRS